MENQDEQEANGALRLSSTGAEDLFGAVYPLNRMVSLYYESSANEWPLPDTENAAPHAKQTEL